MVLYQSVRRQDPDMRTKSHRASVILLSLLVCLGSGCLLRLGRLEPVPAEALRVTPERLARGKYLVEHVAVCIDCHSQRDWNKFSAPIVPGTEGQGGETFDARHGVRGGVVYGSNITPAGIAHWTEDEILRAITVGVSQDGRALFPLMPYRSYRHLTRDDAAAILGYLRTLKAIEHDVPPRRLNPFVRLFIRSFTKGTVRLAATIDKRDTVEYGRYLTTLAGCAECHTTRGSTGQPKHKLSLAGGVGFTLPQGRVIAANITPDKETGIGTWSKSAFIGRFKLYAGPEARDSPIGPGGMNTIMPWTLYAGMREDDLGAIYDYLRQVTAVKNRVKTFTPNTPVGRPNH